MLYKEESIADPPLLPEELETVAALSKEQRTRIDDILLRSASPNWLKMARIVTDAMQDIDLEMHDVPYGYLADRLRHLVVLGKLATRGNTETMRFCELRLVDGPPEDGCP